MGSKTPVDDFSPKTKAKIKIIIMPMPFIPDFENPKIKAAKTMATHCSWVKP